jgi:hypothetical protein
MCGSVGRNACTTLPASGGSPTIFDSVRRKFVRASVGWSNLSPNLADVRQALKVGSHREVACKRLKPDKLLQGKLNILFCFN